MTDPQALLAEQAAEVVGKLTAKQRPALLALCRITSPWGATASDLGVSGNVLVALLHKMLATGTYDGRVNAYRPTPLGYAAASILIERQGK